VFKGIEIRRRYGAGERVEDLASEFGVGRLAVYDALWLHTHRAEVVVPLGDEVFLALAKRAAKLGVSSEDLAAMLVTRGLEAGK
jgi:hypothetical protein